MKPKIVFTQDQCNKAIKKAKKGDTIIFNEVRTMDKEKENKKGLSKRALRFFYNAMSVEIKNKYTFEEWSNKNKK